ncbi:hypothetical protein JHK87_052966 [Glycine soja]|nr:hypothetical protein JHK87_052966 [Glycine soja]
MQDGIYVINSGGAERPPSAMGTSVAERFRVVVGVPAITVARGGALEFLKIPSLNEGSIIFNPSTVAALHTCDACIPRSNDQSVSAMSFRLCSVLTMASVPVTLVKDFRARRHQLQIKGDVGYCKKVPEDVKLEMIYAYEKKIAETAAYMEATQEEDDEEEDRIQEITRLKSGKRPPTTSNEASSTASKKRTTNKKGPLDFLFSKQPEETAAPAPTNEKGKKKVMEVEEENKDEGEEEYNSNASESGGFQDDNDLDLEEDEDSD